MKVNVKFILITQQSGCFVNNKSTCFCITATIEFSSLNNLIQASVVHVFRRMSIVTYNGDMDGGVCLP